jgi:hypothetical protein
MWAQHCILSDERPVEIDGERRDVRREAARELQQLYGVPPVAVTT